MHCSVECGDVVIFHFGTGISLCQQPEIFGTPCHSPVGNWGISVIVYIVDLRRLTGQGLESGNFPHDRLGPVTGQRHRQ